MDSKTEGVNIGRENVTIDPKNHQKQIHAYMEIWYMTKARYLGKPWCSSKCCERRDFSGTGGSVRSWLKL
jgi:hypothetical protein